VYSKRKVKARIFLVIPLMCKTVTAKLPLSLPTPSRSVAEPQPVDYLICQLPTASAFDFTTDRDVDTSLFSGTSQAVLRFESPPDTHHRLRIIGVLGFRINLNSASEYGVRIVANFHYHICLARRPQTIS
jgi:hypothetical protein